MENHINQIIQFIHSQGEQWDLNKLIILIIILMGFFKVLISFIENGLDELGFMEYISIIISIATLYLMIIAIYKIKFL